MTSMFGNILIIVKQMAGMNLFDDEIFLDFRDVFGQLPISLVDMTADYTQLQQTVEGYRQLHAVGLLMPAVGTATQSPQLARELLDCIFKVALPLHRHNRECRAGKGS